MARIILGSYMIRYPLGGVLSSSLQWLVGFQRLGHEIYLVEKSGWKDSCYDPSQNIMTDDCTFGMNALTSLLSRFNLQERWCYVDAQNNYHGMSRSQIEHIFRTAEVFIDRGTHGSWGEEALHAGLRVLIDGEPGATQMKMQKRQMAGESLPVYDHYYTVGQNVGTNQCSVPTAGRDWRKIYHPVVLDVFPNEPIRPRGSVPTVMNWRAHAPLEFEGKIYGQKGEEFETFLNLPQRAAIPLEMAIAGKDVPSSRLLSAGWHLRDAHIVTATFDSYRDYIQDSDAEFSVAKNVFVTTNSGWFSDRSAAYLATGRPVVLQETGFSQHLPCGQGLFAVNSLEDASAAISMIDQDWNRHSRAARQIAVDYLDATKVLDKFLRDLGIAP